MDAETHTHLWNDLPIEERLRLHPYMIETQIRHLEQAKRVAIEAHQKYLRDMNDWIGNLKSKLKEKGHK